MFHPGTTNKDLWANINKVMNPTVNTIKQTTFVDKYNTLIIPNEIANSFNNYFINVIKDIVKNIKISNNMPSEIQEPSNVYSIFMYPTNEAEVTTILSELKQNASPGVDNLHPSAIKLSTPYIKCFLVYLINCSLNDGIFPETLKLARVTPIFKEGDKSLLENYRPISVLNVFSKVYETVIKNRLSTFFDKHNVLYEKQFGFRRNHSTYMPLISLVDQITSNIEQNLYTMVMLLDFKKAFDSVDHLILLNKLNHYGIRGQALNLIKNYLMNRRQQVVYNGVISQVQTITTGVPQGSILGPLFFLVYINDLPKISPSTDFLIFADDTTSIESNKNIETLFHTANDTVRKLDHWCSVNKIALNKQKTKYLLYYPRKTPENKKKELQKKLNIKICGVQIEEVTSAKFLGVIIDNSLTWKPHILSS